jgi:hypothetical protein
VFFYGYGKIKASEATCESEDGGVGPLWYDLDPNEDVWAAFEWARFEDGHEEHGNTIYLRPPAARLVTRGQN